MNILILGLILGLIGGASVITLIYYALQFEGKLLDEYYKEKYRDIHSPEFFYNEGKTNE